MYTFLMVIVLGFQELDSMTSYVYSSDEDIQCNSGTCNEKRRRVHNEVERRRKDKINNWIIRIGDLLPDRNRKKQCINEILEQAVVYIRYLQDANDKLLQDKCTEVQVEELRRMTKKMKELEEENTQCLRLLQKAGISSITCPEEFCDHKSGRYSNKLTPEQASALLTQFENDSLANGVTKLRSVMQNKCDVTEGKSISYSVKYDLSGKKCNEVTESVSENLATCGTEKEVPSEKTVSSISTPQSLPSSCAENQITTATQHCPSPSVSTNSSKCQYAISCSSEETNLSLDVCDITAVTQALPPVPVMSTSQNSSVHENSVCKSAKQSVTPLNQLIQPQILSPCAPAANRGSTIQNISSPLLVINEHGIPVLHNIVSFQNIQPSVFSNCSSAPAILTSSNNGFGQTQSPLAIPQIGPFGNYRPIYITKDTSNSTKVASVPTTFSVAGSPNSSIAGVPILTSNSCFTSTVRPQSTLTGEAKNILSPLIAQVPVPGSSQGGALKLSTGLQSSSLGQGTLSQIISHPMDDLTASNMHIQPCNNHSISQNLPSNTLPPTMVTPGGILVGQPLSIGQHGQVLTMGNGQILTAQSSVSAQQPFPSALILPNGQVIPVVSQPSVVYANPAVNNNIVLAQTGKQNLQAASPSVVTNIKNQNSSLLANSLNNTILFSPSGSTGNNFKFSSVALTLSQASNSQSSTSFTSDMTSTITQKSKTMESLQTSQNDNVIASAEEELLKCSSTTQAFQGPLPAVTCSKSNCHNSEINSRRASTLGTKNASVSKSSKANPVASKRAGRILKPKPSSTSPHHSGMLSAKAQHSGRELAMNTRKQMSSNSSTNNISSSEPSIEKMTNSSNANSCTNSLSSNSPIRTDENVNHDSTETSLVSSSSNSSARMTTDILAKATESIFSSCVSDLSPSITSFSSGKNEVLHNTHECSLLNNEKNKHDDNEQKHNKQHRFYHMDSSNSSVTDSCVSSQPQDLLSTLTATVFGDSSADSSGDELAFTQVESSPSKLISTLSRSVTTKNVKGNSHVEIDIAKLKCRTNNNNGVPPIKKVKTVEPSGNGTATSTVQYRETVKGNCFVSNGLTTSTNNEDSHNRITSTTKCFLSEEKQKIVCSTTNPLSSEMTTMPTSVSQLLLADSTSALCSKSSQRSSERENSGNVNFVNSGENSAPDTELPALILGSLGDDSNAPSSVNGSSNSGIPFLALSPSEHFPSDLPKETPLNNDGSFNMLDNCRPSNIDSIEAVKSKRTPSIHEKGDINKANTSSEFADINSKPSDQSKQVLSSSRLPDQETDISSTLSPPLVMKSNCNQTITSQQGIAHEDNLNAIQKETQCPPTSNILGSTSRNDVNCQAPILSPVSSLSFIAPSPPPLLSRNMINENHVSISSHFQPLSSQNNLGISSSQTHLSSSASSQSSNSTHISSFKQSTERSSTPKKSMSFPTNNPPSIITSTAITSTTSTSTNFASHTTVSHTLSNYSAEALIGQQSTMTSTSLINPIVSQSYYSGASNSDCPRTNRPAISYSAESLIQTQSCINKKQDMVVNKEPMSSNVSPNMNTYRHQTQRLQQHGGQQGVSPQAINVSQSLVTNVTDRRLSCSNLIPSSDMMPQNSLQSNFHLQGTPSYANLTHTISTGPQQNLMNNHFGSGPPILMRHGPSACQQLDQCLPCNQPSHNSSSLPQGYSLALGGNKNCHSVNTFHQNRPPVDASIAQTLPSCLSNSGNLSNIPITNSQQQNGCLFPNHAPSGSLLQVPDTNFSILQNSSSSSSSFNNQVRNESRPPVFNNFPQHAQNSLVNNLFHGPFVTNVNTQRNEISNSMPSQHSNRPNEGIKHATREQRSSSQSQSPPNQTKISPKSKSNAKKSKQNAGTEDVTMPSTHYENINVRMPTHFSVPDLSFPRNDTPCLGNAYFGGSQRPLVPTISNIQTQNKSIPTVASTDPNISANPTYNPLFRRQSDNSLNFNFQPSSFSVNSLHRPATTGSENIPSAQITCHTTTASTHPIPNFNLSNIFPDISTSNESINLPAMKFHHNNHIISPSTSNQIQASEGSMTHPTNHQNRAPPPLYHGRTHPPVIHNGVGFNGILGPNAHAFEGHGSQVAVGINNTMGHPPPPPPPFAPSHSHTPSFGNVLAPLNFPMHDH